MAKTLIFIYLRIFTVGISREIALKFQKIHWRNVFTIEMVILANFAQKVIFWAATIFESEQSLWQFFFICFVFIAGIRRKLS